MVKLSDRPMAQNRFTDDVINTNSETDRVRKNTAGSTEFESHPQKLRATEDTHLEV